MAQETSQPDWDYKLIRAAEAGKCVSTVPTAPAAGTIALVDAEVPNGTVVAIHDDITASGTCLDTVAGILDGGGDANGVDGFASVCVCQGGAWEPL